MSYRTVSTREAGRLAGRVAEAYGLSVRVDRMHSNYRSVIYELVAGVDRYILKTIPQTESGHRGLVDAARLAEALAASGIPTARPVPLRGLPTRFAWREGTLACVLYEYVSGEAFDFERPEQWREGGRTLGRIHGIDPVPACAGPSSLTVEGLVEELRERLERLAGTVPEPTLLSLRSVVEEGDSLTEPIPPGLVHADYRAQNVIMRSGRIAAVLDLDEAGVGDRLLDLAYSVVYFQAVVAEGPSGPAGVEAFLDGYSQTSGIGRVCLPSSVLRLALARGLTLWCEIAYREGQAAPRDRVKGWIDTYLPLLENPGALLPASCR